MLSDEVRAVLSFVELRVDALRRGADTGTIATENAYAERLAKGVAEIREKFKYEQLWSLQERPYITSKEGGGK